MMITKPTLKRELRKIMIDHAIEGQILYLNNTHLVWSLRMVNVAFTAFRNDVLHEGMIECTYINLRDPKIQYIMRKLGLEPDSVYF